MNTPTDIADHIVRTLAAAGESITLRRLMNTLFQIQGWSLALLGRPAFNEAITMTPAGPHIHTVGVAYAHCQGGPIVPSQDHQPTWADIDLRGTRPLQQQGAPQPDEALQAVIKAVLRTYTNAFALSEEIISSPLWAHSRTTQNRIENENLAAWFAQQAPLPMTVAVTPGANPWPVLAHQEVDTAALHRAAMREHLAAQEASDNAWLERTMPAASKPGLLARLGFGKGVE